MEVPRPQRQSTIPLYSDKLTDNTGCPVRGQYYGRKMEKVPDSYLVWLYSQDWLKSKHPNVHKYIVDNAKLLDDIILHSEDRKSGTNNTGPR